MSNRCTRQDGLRAGFIVVVAVATAACLPGCMADFAGPGEAVCGDGTCGESEDAHGCPEDCPPTCGDGFCTHAEDPADCSRDCFAICGDFTCALNETAAMCPQDCPSVCGDGVCTHAEDIGDCAADCSEVCGDGFCANSEGPSACEADCPAVCGDGYVTHTEGCDDGNLDNGDGCGADCQLEPGETACDNDIDDDGDGLTDCEDLDCANTPPCGGGGVPCGDVWTCVQDCSADPTCFAGCESSLCSTAMVFYDTLEICMTNACATECSASPGLASCQSCLSANCSNELDACLLNSCS